MKKTQKFDEARKCLISLELRNMEYKSDQARALKSQKFGPQVISEALSTPLSTVKAWLSDPNITSKRGRKQYLSDDEELLMIAFIKSAEDGHSPMQKTDIVKKVCFGGSWFIIFFSFRPH
jgi:hypothetical protein